MKKLVFSTIVFILFGCTKELTYQYDGVGRIYFEYQTQDSRGLFIPQDSIVFSFGKHPLDIDQDTAKIVVRCMGDSSSKDRTYTVNVMAKGNIINEISTMIEGVHFKAIDKKQTFRAGRFVDTLKIVLYRNELSKSLRNPESRKLILGLEANEHFDLGVPRGQEVMLTSNNTLNAPAWWEKNTTLLGFYHPSKWLLLIDLDPKFAQEPEFAGTGVDMQNKGAMLKDYLLKNILIDDETGMRITFDGLEEL